MPSTQTIQAQYDKLSPDKQAEFKQRVIYNIVNSNYGDRITDFTVDPNPRSGNVASGNFSTPRLGGKKLIVDYAINDNEVMLAPRNLQVIDHDEEKYGEILESLFSFAENIGYVPVEFLSFGRILQCEKGWACGGACLSKTKKNCHQALDPNHKTYVGWLKSQVQKGAALHKGHREEAEKLGLSKKDSETDPRIHSIKTQKQFEDAVMYTYSKLSKKHDDLVPIYEIRRKLGETVARDKFDEYFKEMQAKKIFKLQGGELAGIDNTKASDSINTSTGQIMYYATALNPVKIPKNKEEKIEKLLNNPPPLDELGTARELTKGNKIESQQEFNSVLDSAHEKINSEFKHHNLVPIHTLRKVLEKRISPSDFDRYLKNSINNDKYSTSESANPSEEESKGAYKTMLGESRHYLQKL